MNDRYLRHDLIDWFDQKLVTSMNALVIGAGAVGNEVIKNLCLLGVGQIRIVDFDRIEIHNLTRSVLFTEEDIGKSKAEVAATAAGRLNPDCVVEGVVGDFWHKVRFSELANSSVVFCCVDNFEARLRLNRLCELIGVDLVNIGIDSRYVSVDIFPFRRDPDSACYECNLPTSVYQRVAERYSCGWLKKVSFEEKKIPTTVITASFAGALATSMFLHSFKEDADPGALRIFFDTIGYTLSKCALPMNQSCVCCSTRRSQTILVSGSRRVDQALPWLKQLDPDVTITTSDPLLTAWETPNCATCSADQLDECLALAADFDDSQTVCSKCGLRQRLAVINYQFSACELVEKYRGQMLPGKYVEVADRESRIIVELWDGESDE